ncbi:cell division protein FtsQ/DivIB [Citreimonas salinaria]|uniref:Cell division protein FtsQ n=1 Tax=Citreimonas salinaria TaxID=321339 RepID=A0A1H3FZ63_9RHOB|nr:cell division protein FtsQ/DivIB [Citreimonas salinaria]SDX96383.1 cell division protein FtsQ [Citreimonas salinaria]
MRSLRRDRFDPAPTVWRYRLERLMLTPLFRVTLRVGLPFALVFSAASLWVSVPENRAAVSLMVADLRAQIESRPELQVKLMAIDGATDAVAEEIRATLSLDLPVSSLEMDMARLHAMVEAMDPVQKAELRIRQGGVLQVDIVERVPAILWRSEDKLELLDVGGARVGPAGPRHLYPDLPVIAGEGAKAHVAEALDLYATIGPLKPRLRGFERMGDRRWDVVLDRGQRILLPDSGAQRALERAIAMDQAERVLAQEVVAIDLRLGRRPTLRLTPPAALTLWQVKQEQAEKGAQE